MPSLPKKYPLNRVVYFPDLGYPRHFWETAKDLEIDKSIQATSKAKAFLLGKLEEEDCQHPLENEFSTVSERFFKLLATFIPKAHDQLKSIIIHPTQFGTVGSFNLITSKTDEMELYVRTDASLSKLFEIILTSLTRAQVKKMGGTWEESELLADWLVEYSAFRELLTDEQVDEGTVQAIRSLELKSLRSESEKYIEKLGYRYEEAGALSFESGLFHYGKVTIRGLTSIEKDILTLFLQKSKVGIDDLAEVLFQSEDDFSLYSITKSIQRLRKKLYANGIHRSLILTKRGYGYVLNQ